MLTATQKKTAEAIVNIFETSEVLGDYGMVTLIAGDTGHLTYGRSQTTLGSGNLHMLLEQYCTTPGARFGERLRPILPRFAERDVRLDHDLNLHNLLRACADDPIMRDTQDVFFDQHYWRSAARTAERHGIASPLGVAVVYDSFVHGSWQAIREMTDSRVGEVTIAGERQWISAYVDSRRQWLGDHRRADLRATVYRMDAFRRLIDQEHWDLELPLVVRGREISTVTLTATPPGCYDTPQPGSRVISLDTPLQRGLDVRLLQLGLSDTGSDITADGIFGRTSAQRLREYQASNNLPQTGVADQALIARLIG